MTDIEKLTNELYEAIVLVLEAERRADYESNNPDFDEDGELEETTWAGESPTDKAKAALRKAVEAIISRVDS